MYPLCTARFYPNVNYPYDLNSSPAMHDYNCCHNRNWGEALSETLARPFSCFILPLTHLPRSPSPIRLIIASSCIIRWIRRGKPPLHTGRAHPSSARAISPFLLSHLVSCAESPISRMKNDITPLPTHQQHHYACTWPRNDPEQVLSHFLSVFCPRTHSRALSHFYLQCIRSLSNATLLLTPQDAFSMGPTH